jgi:hypothetical protein
METHTDILRTSGFEIDPDCYRCKRSEIKYSHYTHYRDVCIIENSLNELKKCKEKENLFGIDSCISLTMLPYKYDEFDDDNINKIIGWYIMRINKYGNAVYYCIYIYNKKIKKYIVVE